MWLWARRARRGAALWLLLFAALTAWADGVDWAARLAQGTACRIRGELQQSAQLLATVRQFADSAELRAKAAGELGVTQWQAHRYDEAEVQLREAYAFFSGAARAAYAVHLGNLAVLQKNAASAQDYYREALALAGDDADLRFAVNLNLLRLAPAETRAAELAALGAQLDGQPARAGLARFHLNLAHLARQSGQQALPLAFHHLERASSLSQADPPERIHAEALSALAQLYEDEKRFREALTLNRKGLDAARRASPAQSADLRIDLEWRAARLHRALGRPDAALAALRRAVEQIEQVRQDIPVEYEDGRSSFLHTLQPVYLAYADLLLQQKTDEKTNDSANGKAHDEAAQQARLRSVLDTIELIRQTELQDFLGDRCAVEAVQGGSLGKLAPGTAVLYPLMLPDRLELLLETANGIERKTTPVRESTLRATATRFASILRNGLDDFSAPSRQLYDWLLRPVADSLAANRIHTLIVAPDGALRLLPFGALDDGKQYAIEKYAVSMITGLTMTNPAPPGKQLAVSLIAGLSEPGEVVAKLDRNVTEQILEAGSDAEGARSVIGTRELRAMRRLRGASPQSATAGERREIENLKTRLALPGVKDEVNALTTILPGTRLLDGEFTVRRFSQETGSGDFRIVHIASHGVFGGSAETSFIMAHDDLLTMNGLQSLLRSEKFRKHPIELLSLSACQTAEGNDRSPLGFSGAAIKARAKSVLGTLWPVEDNAARTIMEGVYRGLAGGKLGKSEALRAAQRAMLGQPESAHPFFWAPFVLIGNWQ